MFNEIKLILKNDTIFYTLVIIGVAIASFGLGRLSVVQTQDKAMVPTPSEQSASVVTTSRVEGTATTSVKKGDLDAVTKALTAEPATQLIASKSGTKYHFSWCPGAKQIKEENKITFVTTEAARAAGYTPAANCPGLE